MDEMSLVTIHPKRIRWMKNPWDVVSGFKHDNRLKCHLGIVSQWTFQVGLNVTVDEMWVDVTSRHPSSLPSALYTSEYAVLALLMLVVRFSYPANEKMVHNNSNQIIIRATTLDS